MKKNVYEDFRGERDLRGFTEEVKWKLTSYYGGPEKSGKYLVSNGDGHTKYLMCTGDNNCRELISKFLDQGHCAETPRMFWSDNNEKLTSDEILSLWDDYFVWYKYDDVSYYDYDHYDVMIYRGDDIPKYFLDTELKGPIDSEIDTYEEEISKDLEW